MGVDKTRKGQVPARRLEVEKPAKPILSNKADVPVDAIDDAPARVETAENASSLQAGDPKLGSTTALLDVLLTADKSSFVSTLTRTDRRALEDRNLAKRVGLKLQMVPYGAPSAVLLARLKQDPVISEKLPDLSLNDLRTMHYQHPDVVPWPTLPHDWGETAARPGVEIQLDFWIGMWVERNLDELNQKYEIPTRQQDYRRERFGFPIRGQSFRPLKLGDEFSLHRLMRLARDISENTGGKRGLMLRSVIQDAPPHWGPEQIADEFNSYLDYITTVLQYPRTTAEEAKERAKMTPAQVREMMSLHPKQIGAHRFSERQKKLRGLLADAIEHAKIGDNLYTLLQGVCDAYAADLVKPSGHGLVHHGVTLPEHPPVETTLTPEDLIQMIGGDPAFKEQLAAFLDAKRRPFDQSLAKQIARTIGPRLSKMSVVEISAVMEKRDPKFNEHLVRHLIGSFPKVFGVRRVERKNVEHTFLIAKQISSIMDGMFEGATLDDVAQFIKSHNRDIRDLFPDFSAHDIELLQAAHEFVPQWKVKEHEGTLASGSRMPLTDFAHFVTKRLGRKRSAEVQKRVLEVFTRAPEDPKEGTELREFIDHAYAASVLEYVGRLCGVYPLPEGGRDIGIAQGMAKFLLADDPSMTAAGLTQMLKSPALWGQSPPAQPELVARALIQARDLDFVGLEEAVTQLLAGRQEDIELPLMKLENLTLGYEGLLNRLQNEIFRNEELRSSFERFARIPLKLPMVQSVVDKYKEDKPLENHNVLMVQHMLGQAYPQVAGYQALGMDTDKTLFVGIPYHENHEVEEALVRSFGIQPRVAKRGDIEQLYKDIEKAVDDLVAQHKENGEDMLIVCDGPHARDYFKKAYPDLLDKVKFTEQTAFGDREHNRADTSMRVVSYARKSLKAEKEAKFIAQAVVRATNAVLTELGTGSEEKEVVIMGLGPIGLATAEAYVGSRSRVSVYDPNPTPEALAKAKKLGVQVITDRTEIAKGKFMFVGCSGHLSIDEQMILESEPNAIYVSASSKLVEIDMRRLRELSTDQQGRVRRVLAAEVNNQQTWHYWMKDGTIRTVIADGLPANFNDINSVPPEFIDMTMSMSLAAAVQAVSGDEHVFEDLNDEDHDMLDAMFDEEVLRIKRDEQDAAGPAKKPPPPD